MTTCRRKYLSVTIVGVLCIVYYVSTWQSSRLHRPFGDKSVVLSNQIRAVQPLSEHSLTSKHVRRTVDNTTQTPPSERGVSDKRIIILTTRRSGSSFVGQLFNEHPDIAYLFEPMQLIKFGGTLADLSVDVIRSYMKKIFSCAYSDALHDVKELPMRASFLSHFVCASFLRHWKQGHGRYCTEADIKLAEFICRLSKYVAVKTIRIYAKQLPLVQEYLRERVQIIHLHRDPRGVMSSRITIDQFKARQQRTVYIQKNVNTLVRKASTHCRRVRDAVERIAAWTSVEPSLKQFYHVVRYEDFAYHPEARTKALYASLGVELHSNVLAWIRKATVNNTSNGHLFYSTSRNSTQTAEAWRHKLPFYYVHAIQQLPNCQYVIRKLGYEFARSQEMLHNTSLSLVREFG
ncbi:hypothetical protein NP493_97g01001 [Ridgeia piscesae]|uniref:Sulfotransferase n=1 Tax=Ridgeia piscesae TaxID=27915 RepID=A0AAD9P7U9_RIDPI|nr:hypothetical protein NP493_97g01001 [Ridgeia piscesae]